jgi:hypothetical protein
VDPAVDPMTEFFFDHALPRTDSDHVGPAGDTVSRRQAPSEFESLP